MQRFQKWKFPKRSIQVGDIVLLKDPELFNKCWPTAVVEQVYPGVVTIRTTKGTYRPPLCLYPEKRFPQPPPRSLTVHRTLNSNYFLLYYYVTSCLVIMHAMLHDYYLSVIIHAMSDFSYLTESS